MFEHQTIFMVFLDTKVKVKFKIQSLHLVFIYNLLEQFSVHMWVLKMHSSTK